MGIEKPTLRLPAGGKVQGPKQAMRQPARRQDQGSRWRRPRRGTETDRFIVACRHYPISLCTRNRRGVLNC